MTNFDISTTGTQDLIEEIHRRHGACVIITNKDGKNDPSQEDIELFISGGQPTCIGMVLMALAELIQYDQEAE